MRFHVIDPIELAGFGIEAMDEAGEIADKQQAGVGINRNGGDAAMDFVVAPDLAGLGDVAGFGGVDAGQNAHAFAVLGILADGDIDAVFVEDGRGVDFAGAFGGRDI